MSDLIIAAYGRQHDAFAAGESLAALQREAGVEPEDIVVVTRDAAGRVSVNQSIDLATGRPLAGGRWGALIGMLFLDRRDPRTSRTGLSAQLRAAGLDPTFLTSVVQALDKGGAAVGLRVRMLGLDRVRARLDGLAGRPVILHSELTAEAEDALYEMRGQVPPAALGRTDRGGPN